MQCTAVTLSMAGVFLISYEDFLQTRTNIRMLGDFLAVISAMVYALYAVLLKVRLSDREDDEVPMAKLSGAIGTVVLVTAWPLGLFLDLISFEQIQNPSNSVAAFITLNASFSMAAQYLWSYAVLYTTPTLAAVGMSLSIPMAQLSDKLLKDTSFQYPYAVGAMLVVSAFLILSLEKKLEGMVRRAFEPTRER